MTEDKFIILSQDIYLNETPKDIKLFSLKMRICSYDLSFETDSSHLLTFFPIRVLILSLFIALKYTI